MLTICLPVRLGKACAISATAPLIVGAEKLVPDQRNCGAGLVGRTVAKPSAVRYHAAPVPARFEKSEMVLIVGGIAADRAGDDHRAREGSVPGSSANGSGLLPLVGSSPSLPAEMTSTIPALTARCIAASSWLPGGSSRRATG